MSLLDIGETIKQDYDNAAECSKQCAIRTTEEVVRREEKQHYEELLEQARSQWKKEREQLLKDCEKEREKSIKLEKAQLETKLRSEFDRELAEMKCIHEDDKCKAVRKAWEDAEIIKNRIVEETRLEEKEIAAEIAKDRAQCVKQEKIEAENRAEQIKLKALEDQKQQMEILQTTHVLLLEQELQSLYEGKLSETCEQYDLELVASQQLIDEKCQELQHVQDQLEEMTNDRDNWKLKYDNLKIEFSDFIEQFPGFSADFLLS